MSLKPVYLLEGKRTPHAKAGSALKDVQAPFLGAYLVRHLLDNTNYEIAIADRLDFKLDNEFKATRYSNSRVTFHQEDIRNLDFMGSIINEGSYVVNLAALVGEPLCKLKPDEAVEVNYEAAKNLAELCKRKNVKKFIQLSGYVSLCKI